MSLEKVLDQCNEISPIEETLGSTLNTGKKTWTLSQMVVDLGFQNALDANVEAHFQKMRGIFFTEDVNIDKANNLLNKIDYLSKMKVDEAFFSSAFSKLGISYLEEEVKEFIKPEFLLDKGFINHFKIYSEYLKYPVKLPKVEYSILDQSTGKYELVSLEDLRDKEEYQEKILRDKKDEENKEETYRYKIIGFRVKDEGLGFDHQLASVYASDKKEQEHSRGRFGEGSKLSQIQALNSGVSVVIQSILEDESTGKKISWALRPTEMSNKEVFNKGFITELEDSVELQTGSRVIFDFTKVKSEEDLLELEKIVDIRDKKVGLGELIRSYSSNEIEYYPCNGGILGISNREENSSKAFLKDLPIKIQNYKLLFEYNFFDDDLLMGRDRNILNTGKIIRLLSDFWQSERNTHLIKEFLEKIIQSGELSRSLESKVIDDYPYILDYLLDKISEEELLNIIPLKEGVDNIFIDIGIFCSQEYKDLRDSNKEINFIKIKTLSDITYYLTEYFRRKKSRFKIKTLKEALLYENDGTEISEEEERYKIIEKIFNESKNFAERSLRSLGDVINPIDFVVKSVKSTSSWYSIEKIKDDRVIFVFHVSSQENLDDLKKIRPFLSQDILSIAQSEYKFLSTDELKQEGQKNAQGKLDNTGCFSNSNFMDLVMHKFEYKQKEISEGFYEKLFKEETEEEKKIDAFMFKYPFYPRNIISKERLENFKKDFLSLLKNMDFGELSKSYQKKLEYIKIDSMYGVKGHKIYVLMIPENIFTMSYEDQVKALKIEETESENKFETNERGLRVKGVIELPEKNRSKTDEIGLRVKEIIEQLGKNIFEIELPDSSISGIKSFQDTFYFKDGRVFNEMGIIDESKFFFIDGRLFGPENSFNNYEYLKKEKISDKNNSIDSKKLRTTIGIDYGIGESTWDDAVRILEDIYQNHKDADSKSVTFNCLVIRNGKEVEISVTEIMNEDEIISIMMKDKGAGYYPDQVRLLGGGGKEDPFSAGKYGEGLKMVAASSVRNGFKLEYSSRVTENGESKKWTASATKEIKTFRNKSDKEFLAFDLTIESENTEKQKKAGIFKKLLRRSKKVKREDDYTSSTILSLPKDADEETQKKWKEWTDSLKNLSQGKHKGMAGNIRGIRETDSEEILQYGLTTLLLEKEEQGNIYEQGLKIKDSENTLFGWDVATITATRERNAISENSLNPYIEDIFNNKKLPNEVIDKIVEELSLNLKSDNLNIPTEFIILSSIYKEGSVNYQAFKKAILKKFGRKIVVQNEEYGDSQIAGTHVHEKDVIRCNDIAFRVLEKFLPTMWIYNRLNNKKTVEVSKNDINKCKEIVSEASKKIEELLEFIESSPEILSDFKIMFEGKIPKEYIKGCKLWQKDGSYFNDPSSVQISKKDRAHDGMSFMGGISFSERYLLDNSYKSRNRMLGIIYHELIHNIFNLNDYDRSFIFMLDLVGRFAQNKENISYEKREKPKKLTEGDSNRGILKEKFKIDPRDVPNFNSEIFKILKE